MNTKAIFIPDLEVSGPKLSLSKKISAIQLVAKEDGQVKLGLLTQLSAGTVVERCGKGFNERTTKVRADGQCYFVFIQDIESEPESQTRTSVSVLSESRNFLPGRARPKIFVN